MRSRCGLWRLLIFHHCLGVPLPILRYGSVTLYQYRWTQKAPVAIEVLLHGLDYFGVRPAENGVKRFDLYDRVRHDICTCLLDFDVAVAGAVDFVSVAGHASHGATARRNVIPLHPAGFVGLESIRPTHSRLDRPRIWGVRGRPLKRVALLKHKFTETGKRDAACFRRAVRRRAHTLAKQPMRRPASVTVTPKLKGAGVLLVVHG